MKILIAPDSFKGSLTALEVANNIEEGINNIYPEAKIIKVPMADGGEGTTKALVDATDGEIIHKKVTGPLGEKVKAYFGILGNKKTAVIEMASASGFDLIPLEKANPYKTTTYGTGELIKSALDKKVEKIIIGVGGSATNDGGVGMAQAVGVKFIDSKGKEIEFGGYHLDKIKKIDTSNLDPRIKDVNIEVACDVDNPLYGKNGAAYVYAPQKGANDNMVQQLDKNLRYFSKIVKKELNKDIKSLPGGGAAGGLGAGLVAFLGAELKSGVDLIIEANNLLEKMQNVDLVITGEGKIDKQTINGKTPMGVLKAAQKYDIPVIAVCGILGEGYEYFSKEDLLSIFSIINEDINLNKIMENTPKLLRFLVEEIMKTIKNILL